MDLAHAFGVVLKKHRKKAGFSQEKLAEVCGIERTFVSMLERAERRPSLAMTFDLAKALNVSASELVIDIEKAIKSNNND
ncbi:helix-turn-helix domain-containing protein [Aliikangiella sp. IMCC44359]|uniref:helix-turn-helix domain-containing protein n=1 Tax=Aliikangiella sp. IMCC44359 TaxID=3459125 RepID=UPI00403AC4DB